MITKKYFFRRFILLLAIALPWTSSAHAMDFKVSGEWLMGFGAGTGELYSHYRDSNNSPRQKVNSNDIFEANQRVRLQLDAIASESLSGTVFLEIGDQRWGKADQGGALGADGDVIRLKTAYLDWAPPDCDLNFRMGIQAIVLPNVAGGSAILDADVAGITASWKLSESIALTAIWARPVNDNYTRQYGARPNRQGYLDNIDLFALSMPITMDGYNVTPWLMYGMLGKNSLRGLEPIDESEPWMTSDGVLGLTVPGLVPGINYAHGTPLTTSTTSKAYGSMFWAGLPIGLTLWDPWNIEIDINYGYVEEMGRYDVIKRGDRNDIVRGSTQRQGWLFKGLIEYIFPWGVPGILGWYSTGDDGNIKNGSERIPSIAGASTFTTFLNDGGYGWGTFDDSCNIAMTYSGTWGLGLQLRDISFIDDLTHTLRAVYWGGTNSPGMVKYMTHAYSWREGYYGEGPYLTTNDGLLEINIINNWQIYENLSANLELSYIANMIDKGTWVKSGYYNGAGNGKFEKQDVWKAQLIFAYTF